ncbi:uncharacterized protein BYT42DRAFT_41644 [Radiomyces spectabilis]|uniref:uncharacterized protein n=1 Tax=Radiomyces spectabilis TaxID=64574 RepID=UPI00221F05E4|nr:uncharacterized protein BYT42DRAFT_41644 [Radiomyces spectabilis]KAI8394352.1 hypothetical protein BYT42DRAFT_41644 [Radiomyces spectabilis]
MLPYVSITLVCLHLFLFVIPLFYIRYSSCMYVLEAFLTAPISTLCAFFPFPFFK